MDDLNDLFARSDIVSLHAPAIPETEKMVGEEQLRRLRPGAVLINTARGALIDHEALYRVAQEGKIQVFLDVTLPEPLPAEHPLRRLPNVYITPHMAGTGYYGYWRIGAWTVQAVENFFADRPFEGEVDLSRWEQLA
ncbi:MAG: hypothetical protein KatS3mg115_0994 [Candidatus Poribacteria bacterium]|nr:MAG: hypothetical protein KatS3mg115_0994 [Candidatus Poribacteria bacterium]